MRSSLPPRPGGPLRALLTWETAAVLAAVILYAPTVTFGWVYDDQMEVVRNTFVTSLANLPRIFGTTVWTGSGMETFLYRPLALVTYAVNHQVSGTSPWSYHAVNVLLHAGAAALVVRLGLGWGLPRLAAGLAGILFAVHPVHVEAVVPVFGRKDLLATLFVLGTLLTHRGALARGGARMVAAPILYLAAMLSKEVGAVGVALVVAQDLLLERDRKAFLRRPRVPLLYASYLLAAALYLAARSMVVGGLGIPDTSFFDNPLVAVPLATRLATAWVVSGKGLLLQILPVGQSPDYSFDAVPLVSSVGDPRLAAALAGTALGVGVLALPRVRRSPYPLALACYGLALLPTANVLVLSGTLFAERLLYLPSVAFCLVAGTGLAWLAERGRGAAGWAVAVAVLGAFSVQTARYASVWTDDVALFRYAVEAVPASTKAHHKLGEELLRRGELEGALRSLHRALEIAPENVWAAETLTVARSQVASRYLPEAEQGRFPEDPELLYALGSAALDGADTATAVESVERAVRRDPGMARGWLTLAALRLGRGDTTGVVEALDRFLDTSQGRYPTQEEGARAFLDGLGRRR